MVVTVPISCTFAADSRLASVITAVTVTVASLIALERIWHAASLLCVLEGAAVDPSAGAVAGAVAGADANAVAEATADARAEAVADADDADDDTEVEQPASRRMVAAAASVADAERARKQREPGVIEITVVPLFGRLRRAPRTHKCTQRGQ